MEESSFRFAEMVCYKWMGLGRLPEQINEESLSSSLKVAIWRARSTAMRIRKQAAKMMMGTLLSPPPPSSSLKFPTSLEVLDPFQVLVYVLRSAFS